MFEIILNLGQWFMRRLCFKIFFISSSVGLFVEQSRTIGEISVEGIIRNIFLKLS